MIKVSPLSVSSLHRFEVTLVSYCQLVEVFAVVCQDELPPGTVQNCYIVQPDNAWEKHKASSGHSKFNIQVRLLPVFSLNTNT